MHTPMSALLLNAPQREAIHYLDGPSLVLAGAGSGKTRVITQKIAYLITECGFNPHNIAAITFTNKAAKEMLERINKLMGGRATKGLTVCTFHALGVRIVRQESKLLGLKPQFSILDASDTTQIIAEMTGNTDKNRAKALQWQISSWKNALIEPNEAAHLANDEISSSAALLYQEYDKTLRAYHGVDFDDLIRLPVKLFDEHPEVRERWQKKVGEFDGYIFVTPEYNRTIPAALIPQMLKHPLTDLGIDRFLARLRFGPDRIVDVQTATAHLPKAGDASTCVLGR